MMNSSDKGGERARQTTVRYIRESLAAGESAQQVRKALLDAGHASEDVDAAFRAVQGGSAAPSPGASPGRLPGVGALFRYSFRVYRAHFWTFLFVALVPVLVMIGAGFVAGGATFLLGSLSIFFAVPLILLFAAVLIMAQIWGVVAFLETVCAKGEIRVLDAYKKSLPKLRSYVWFSVVLWFVSLGALFLFFVPYIIFSVWFVFVLYILVVEGDRGMNVLAKSREYVRGYWWAIVGRSLAFSLIVGGGMMLVILPLLFVGGEGSGVADLLSSLLGFFLAPLGMIYTFGMYEALKKMKPEVAQQQGFKKGLFVGVGVLGVVGTILVVILMLVFARGLVGSLLFNGGSFELGTGEERELANQIAFPFLDPDELERERRDSQRLSDLSTLHSVNALFLADVTDQLCRNPGVTYTSQNGTTAVDGTGWLPIDFTQIVSGSPIRQLPQDPVNQGIHSYSFICTADNEYEFTAKMESEKFVNGGVSDVESEDDGTDPHVYEVGSDLTLIL
jgi:hypothetical protein